MRDAGLEMVAAVVAERDRYKGALERIRDLAGYRPSAAFPYAPECRACGFLNGRHASDRPCGIAAEALAAQPGERG